MFYDDIILVTETIAKFGLVKPLVDLGGMQNPCIADYSRTIESGNQDDRYITFQTRPFDHIDEGYLILNPDKGDPFIEELPSKYPEQFGTILCLSVMEHVDNPFEIFKALYEILKPDGLLIVSTVFEFPYHPSPNDFWRYTAPCLKYLAEKTNFTVLEFGNRLDIEADAGILDPNTNRETAIKSVFISLSKTAKEPLGNPEVYEIPKAIQDR